MDYRDVIDDFIACTLTGRGQMEAFVRSLARHPGLSLDNQVLLYLQEPEAPRRVVTGAYLEARKITQAGQVVLMRQVEKDGRPFLMAEFMYVIRDEDDPEERPDVSIRKLCSDRGLVILRSEHTEAFCLSEDGMRLMVPAAWPPGKVWDTVMEWLIDHLRGCHAGTWCDGADGPEISEVEWNDLYRPGLLLMLRLLMTEEKVDLSLESVIGELQGEERDSAGRWSRLQRLNTLYSEYVREFEEGKGK